MSRTRPLKAKKTPRKRICKLAGCGRIAYSRELCQTHHRQLKSTGKTRPIRPYRPRQPGTTKFAGLRLSVDCAQQLKALAERENISKGAAIAGVLEHWLAKR